MAAIRLTTENVRIILCNILSELSYFEWTDKEAEKQLSYIAGVNDMANAVIRTIKELGGK